MNSPAFKTINHLNRARFRTGMSKQGL